VVARRPSTARCHFHSRATPSHLKALRSLPRTPSCPFVHLVAPELTGLGQITATPFFSGDSRRHERFLLRLFDWLILTHPYHPPVL
jgi:hypothetical protein